ncbi:Myeloid cell surface antigen CD33 precursor (gp67) (Siglec-3) (), isoform CRA_a [Pelobates cultripes]|uniref:Myeloid cell surface antigen CD33 (Gp67) (Siglec-3) ( ), isoform CRA_a n=1 Tax=Pelobates cultripes TaxID=61616 RepID=A0AAD1WR44_PELCU|nr:Myeloid cell surface antigen CD33 precursor (gp67) (Siglec-3) (), isoform CRA_a [Pelobates cultripes]
MNISRQHTDTYGCEALNEHGNASIAVSITVLYPPTITTHISGEKQVSDGSYVQSVIVKEESSVILRCSVDSNPPANMTIMKAADTFARIISGRELILHLRNISHRETGIYNISAINEHGTSYSIINISIPDSSNAANQITYKDKKSNNLVRDMMIGVLCGMIIALCVIGIVKFIAKSCKNTLPGQLSIRMWLVRYYMDWVSLTVIFLPIWKDIGCYGDNSDYTITVNDVTVQEGLCVTVPCTFTIDRSKRLTQAVGYWGYYDEKYCTAGSACYVVSSKKSVSLSYRKKNFHMAGNVNNRDCSLTINNAKKRDGGYYYFRIEDGVDGTLKWNYRDSYLRVTVTDLTAKPQIILPEKLVAGNEVTLTCKPPDTGNCSGTAPEITWVRLEKEDRAESDPLIICGEKRTRISQCKESTLTFTLSQNDHQTAITCDVTSPVVGKSIQTSVTLDVQYPPFISITTETSGID